MKLWTKIKNWITKPYFKPLVLKKDWEINTDLKHLKTQTKAELEKKMMKQNAIITFIAFFFL